MQNLQIQKPCSENWNLMNATEKGTHRFPVEVSDYISGMYLIVISSEKYKETVRLMKQ